MDDAPTRAPDDTLQAHFAAVGAGDLDAIVADYREDAAMVTSDGVVTGRDGIRTAFAQVLGALPDATLDVTGVVVHDGVALVDWTVEGDGVAVRDGVDTFTFDETGAIRVHTVHFTITPT